MPRIHCYYIDCVFLDDGYCSALEIENDPDVGCMTYTSSVDTEVDDRWEDEEDKLDGWEDMESDDDESWLEETEFKADV